MKRLGSLGVWAALLLCSGFATALPTTAQERDRIRRERVQVEADYARREAACRERFVVTSCLDEARAQRRRLLAQLRTEEVAADSRDRRERATERMDRIRRKPVSVGAAASGASVPAPRQPPVPKIRLRSGDAPPEGVGSAPSATGDTSDRASSKAPMEAARAADARERAAATQRRRAQIEAHRASVEQRNADKARIKTPAAPLPAAPSAASR